MEEGRKIRNLNVLSIVIGVLLSIVIIALFRTTIISNKIDYEARQVQSLICTFEEVEYQAKDVMSNATLETLTHVNVTTDNAFYRFFTRDVSQGDFVDMGIIHWEDESLFAIAPKKLENNTKYVIEDGRIIELYYYGLYQNLEPCVKIATVRNANWLDETLLAVSIEISAIIMFLFVLIATLFALPFFRYYRSLQERRRRKKGKRVGKTGIDKTVKNT